MNQHRKRIWRPLDPGLSSELGDARRQLHHAVQLASAFGISYLESRPDDSHTNLEWIEARDALASNELSGIRIELRLPDLTLKIRDSEFGLLGRTVTEGAKWVMQELQDAGLDPEQYTLVRHYRIPYHAVSHGEQFDAKPKQLEELAAWFSNAAVLLEEVRGTNPNASGVRCWPHHFDIATLLEFDAAKTLGAGLEPGDAYYDEPYFYVNVRPVPDPAELPDSLRGGGSWHKEEWIGAVLTGSRLAGGEAQEAQAREFLSSAVETCTRIVTHPTG